MSGLTDEQIAEGLKLAREMVAQPGLRLLMWGTLAATALALQAKLEPADADLALADQVVRDKAERIESMTARLLAHETERTNAESRARREAFEEAAVFAESNVFEAKASKGTSYCSHLELGKRIRALAEKPSEEETAAGEEQFTKEEVRRFDRIMRGHVE